VWPELVALAKEKNCANGNSVFSAENATIMSAYILDFCYTRNQEQ
jgi:hypothetical protein